MCKSDRELLEFAAKAACLDDDLSYDEKWGCYTNYEGITFDPLTDDGDALRLAVKLEFEVGLGQFGTIVYLRNGKVEELGHDDCDYMGLCRRAIVRAAAAIGESMQ